jgi:AraC-like DNA-binding protein
MLNGENVSIQKKSDHNWYKKHWHNYFEIIYYNNCTGYCSLNGIDHELRDNCLFFLTPKDFHEISTNENADSYSMIISFSEQIVDKKILKLLTEESIVIYDLPTLLSKEIDALYEVFLSRSVYRDTHLKHLLNCILIRILEIGQRVSSASKDIHPIIRESISYILTNPSEHITLDTLSSRFGITKTYFSHLFRDSTGVSFKQYLTSLRLECAKRMLAEKELSIIDVGFECGFVTPSQFSRSFKQNTGMTPSQYRMQSNS